ncbi:hypothetical protein HHK36_029441 [Tetracentron sinense]|uniref:Uncharacterized protein n=1 Tax=Tetracentron sinense TaxID=13715 RepID=A0A834YF77_TETSI|nr:hypothetical protein HHK36_029441 [Tetracentron sinense]
MENVQTGRSFPAWLRTQKELVEIHLNNVGISDTVPDWFWKLPDIMFLDLSNNQIRGTLPSWMKLPDIEYLDLSNNQIRGTLPSWMNFSNAYEVYLSSNLFSGPIPVNIGETMPRLVVLDLYGNFLNGSIPYSIGKLKNLATLILSNNQFSGELPGFWKGLQSLQSLAIGNNNLTGNQLQTLTDPSIYEGNQALCGPPLVAKRLEEPSQGPPSIEDKDDENGSDMLWFYISMALGFIVGFWGVCGTLLIKKTWRHAYFRFFDNMKDRLFVIIAVNVTRLKRKMALVRNQGGG